jgi:hypothetical protein
MGPVHASRETDSSSSEEPNLDEFNRQYDFSVIVKIVCSILVDEMNRRHMVLDYQPQYPNRQTNYREVNQKFWSPRYTQPRQNKQTYQIKNKFSHNNVNVHKPKARKKIH